MLVFYAQLFLHYFSSIPKSQSPVICEKGKKKKKKVRGGCREDFQARAGTECQIHGHWLQRRVSRCTKCIKSLLGEKPAT